jgi:hypothetical protein
MELGLIKKIKIQTEIVLQTTKQKHKHNHTVI